jgi:hypothetical protein
MLRAAAAAAWNAWSPRAGFPASHAAQATAQVGSGLFVQRLAKGAGVQGILVELHRFLVGVHCHRPVPGQPGVVCGLPRVSGWTRLPKVVCQFGEMSFCVDGGHILQCRANLVVERRSARERKLAVQRFPEQGMVEREAACALGQAVHDTGRDSLGYHFQQRHLTQFGDPSENIEGEPCHYRCHRQYAAAVRGEPVQALENDGLGAPGEGDAPAGLVKRRLRQPSRQQHLRQLADEERVAARLGINRGGESLCDLLFR